MIHREDLYSPLELQIDRLAECILEHFPNEPGRTGNSEGAVDVAIRLIAAYREHLTADSEAS